MRALFALALLASGCGGEPITAGLTEPMRVRGAQFREGPLPGLPPLTSQDIVAGVEPVPPSFTAIDIIGTELERGELDKSISGRTTTDGVAVALRFPDAGNGYWLTPVSAPDPTNGGELTWNVDVSINRALEPGRHTLHFAAIDASGRSGNQGSLELCVRRDVPDNGNVCDSNVAPPALVVSLAWDTEVDLDLRVITPSGKVVDGKSPTTARKDTQGEIDTSAPGIGVLDRDSNAGCVRDGRRRENLVFQQAPERGVYLVYANLFDACDESSVRFDVSLHAAAPQADGTYQVVETFRQPGGLTTVHANAGKSLGLFVTQFRVQ